MSKIHFKEQNKGVIIYFKEQNQAYELYIIIC